MLRTRAFIITAVMLFAPLFAQSQTSLELQAIQTREFDCSIKVAFNAVISVFQDLGYTINSASLETGLITAKSPSYTAFENLARYTKEEKATAFVEPSAQGRIKIRLTIVRGRKALGRGEEEVIVVDPEIYQSAFIKIQNAIFIRNNLSHAPDKDFLEPLASLEAKASGLSQRLDVLSSNLSLSSL